MLDTAQQDLLATQVEQYGPYPDRIPGAEIRTVLFLKLAVYGRIFTVYGIVYGSILRILRSVFLRSVYGPYRSTWEVEDA